MFKITMIGTGYIGLVTGTILADKGNRVICVDKNQKIVDLLNNGKIHIYEPNLEELVKKNVSNNNLFFTKDIKEAVKSADIIFIGVNTPSNQDGSFNLDYLFQAVKDVGESLKNCEGYKIIVIKSTVPQGTHIQVEEILDSILKDNKKITYDYVSNPETLAEGTAVRDFEKPDRIIIGTKSQKAYEIMEKLYHPFNIRNDRIIKGSPADAELAKLFSNTVLASRVSIINEFARIADITANADITNIRKMVCEDKRIGHSFMFPSPGYGGSCFPKDIQGVVSKSTLNGFNPTLLSTIHNSNEEHKKYVADKIISKLKNVKNKEIGIWGVTFKPNTDDMRDSASITIINKLLEHDFKIKVFDPKCEKAKEIFNEKVEFVDKMYDATLNVEALVLLTEWTEFDSPDFDLLKKNMVGKTIFDFRNRWIPEEINSYGFNYYSIGRNYELK